MFSRIFHSLVFASLAVGLVCCQPTELSAQVSDDAKQKLTAGLEQTLSEMKPGDLAPVLITMQRQATDLEWMDALRHTKKQTRRRSVISLLKRVASESQTDLLRTLTEGQAKNRVDDVKPFWLHNFVAARADRETILQIARRDDVSKLALESIIDDSLFPYEVVKGDGRQGGSEIDCGVDLMQAPRVWDELGLTGQGVVVAVIDTGICFDHPDLTNQRWVNEDEIPGNGIDDDGNGQIDDINGWNFRDDTADLTDFNGHGTHVSGTVGGDGTNGVQTGMAPDVEIMGLRFLNALSGESVAMACVQYAVDNEADVISASWGWLHEWNPDRALWRSLMENTMAAGVVSVFAAGNDRNTTSVPDSVRTPADVPDIITVGATNCDDELAGFSSPGPVTWENISPYLDWPLPDGKIKPSIAAPGVATLSTSPDCVGYFFASGTSMSTPHIAGTVALMLQKNPELDHFDVKQILMDSSLDLGPAGFDNDFGMGRVDAYLAVQATPDPTISVTPESLQVNTGQLASGTVIELEASDNQDLSVRRNPSSFNAVVDIEMSVTSTILAPGELEFTFEASVFSRGSITQTISLFNFTTNSFEQVDQRIARQFTDEVVQLTPTGDVSRFVDPTSGQSNVRVVFQASQARNQFTANIDQVQWTLTQ